MMVIMRIGKIQLSAKEIDLIKKVFGIKELGKEYMLLDDVTEILKHFGITEDLPKSKKHLNYQILNLKSKRIINRFIKHLLDKN